MPRLNYESDDGAVGTTFIGRGFEGAYGAEPATAPTFGYYIRKSGSKRQKGIQARCLLLRLPDGPATPSGAQPYRFAKATVGTQAAYNAYAVGATITIKGNAWEIYGKQPEG